MHASCEARTNGESAAGGEDGGHDEGQCERVSLLVQERRPLDADEGERDGRQQQNRALRVRLLGEQRQHTGADTKRRERRRIDRRLCRREEIVHFS